MIMPMQFYDLEICDVEPLTDEAVAIQFSVPDELSETFAFTPGQYLTLRADINGEDIRRSYSICAPLGEALRVGIKQIEDGRFSSWAQRLVAGATLQVMPPQGRFTCKPQDKASRNILLIAAGSGITPILSIAASVLQREPYTQVTLIYGNRRTDTIMFKEALEDLKDQYLDRFHMYHVLSREMQDVDLFHGRVDVGRVQQFIAMGLITPDQCDAVYLCGPSEMTLSIADFLKAQGVDADKVHTELFEVAGEDRPIVISQETKKAVEEGVSVEIILDGVTKQFILEDENDTVLQAAEKSGLDLPFSCAGGMCATCRCKLMDGAADMDRNFSLDDWEVEAGFLLACQSRPKSSKLVLDFDAA